VTDEERVRWVPKAAFAMPLLPPELKVDPVLAALLHCMAFLDLSGDDAVDPDWAVEVMEHVGAYLQRLSEEDANAISRQLGVIGAYAREQGAPAGFVEFVGTFLEDCGVQGPFA
jgi:hypothetical protein